MFAYACDRCRGKHQSCDHTAPCKRCVKAGLAEFCHYTPKKPRANSKLRTFSIPAGPPYMNSPTMISMSEMIGTAVSIPSVSEQDSRRLFSPPQYYPIDYRRSSTWTPPLHSELQRRYSIMVTTSNMEAQSQPNSIHGTPTEHSATSSPNSLPYILPAERINGSQYLPHHLPYPYYPAYASAPEMLHPGHPAWSSPPSYMHLSPPYFPTPSPPFCAASFPTSSPFLPPDNMSVSPLPQTDPHFTSFADALAHTEDLTPPEDNTIQRKLSITLDEVFLSDGFSFSADL